MKERRYAGLRICLLTDQELDTVPFDEDDWPCDPRPYIPEAEWTLATLEKESCVSDLLLLSRQGFDVFFNLCDGAWDEGRVGIEVVQTLEMLGVPFTGADAAFFEPSREAMKRVCAALDIATPRYVMARAESDIARAASELDFPLFVKHPSSYASNGLTRDSRVTDRAGLEREVRRCLAEYGAALIEEFIEGREATVLVAENPEDPGNPVAHTPLEFRFPPGESFKHYALKWVDYAGLEAAPVLDPQVDARLRDMARRFFLGMRGAGYARCDVRIDRQGTPYMLEINPNCGVFYPPTDPGSADLCLMGEESGHRRFATRLVDAALTRRERARRAWTVLQGVGGRYATFATRSLEPGQEILDPLAEPHRVVRWNADAGEDAEVPAGGWPLSDELWLTWSDDPASWIPMGHSCDPSAWLEDERVVARRALAAGEEITLDFATLHPGSLRERACSCGAARCRGVVGGDDWQSELGYDRNVSAYVRRRREELSVTPLA